MVKEKLKLEFHNGISKLAKEHGIGNLRFHVQMRPTRSLGLVPGLGYTDSSDEMVLTECIAIENRYAVAENYKIQLVALNGSGKEIYYIADLEGLMKYEDDYFITLV